MNVEELLREHGSAIVDEAWPKVAGLAHYQRDGQEATRRRLEALYQQIARAVLVRDLADLRAHAARIARERLAAGFDVSEVQAAFSALEAAIWRHALAYLAPDESAWGIALIGTAFAHVREALGRTFVATSPGASAPSVDMTRLFRGTDPRADTRPADELVFPV